MDSYETRKLSPDQLIPNPLLEQCRKESTSSSAPLPAPSWVTSETEEQYRVLWQPPGAESQKGTLPAFVILDSQREDWEWTLLLWGRYGSFSVLESADILAHFNEQGFSKESRLDIMDTYFNLPRSERWLEIYQSLSGQPDSIRSALAEGTIDPRHFHYLADIEDFLSEQVIQAQAADELSISVQQTRQWVEAVRRLDDNQRDTLSTWLKQLLNDDSDPGDRSQKLLEKTKSVAYPETRRARKEFENDLDNISLPGSIQVQPPNNFEGDYLDIRLRCHRDQSLNELAEDLKKCQILFKHV